MAGMGKEDRLTTSSQFAAVFKKGKPWANDLMVLRVMPNNLDFSRTGIITSKKVGNAVTRNRTKRLLREAVRLNPVEPGWDIVIVARRKMVGKNFWDVQFAFIQLLERAGLLRRV